MGPEKYTNRPKGKTSTLYLHFIPKNEKIKLYTTLVFKVLLSFK